MRSRFIKATLAAVLVTGLLLSAFVLAGPALAATWGQSATGGIQGDFNMRNIGFITACLLMLGGY